MAHISENFIVIEQVKGSKPDSVVKVDKSELREDEQRWLNESLVLRRNAFNPRNLTAISATFVVETSNDTIKLDGVNENASDGITSCAEKNAYYIYHGKKRVTARTLVITAGRFVPATRQISSKVYEPPAFPCGTCRNLLAQAAGKTSRFRIPAQTEVITGDSLGSIIYRTNIEALLPLTYLDKRLDSEANVEPLKRLGLLISLNELSNISIPFLATRGREKFCAQGLSGELIDRMLRCSRSKLPASQRGCEQTNTAASILTGNNKIYSSVGAPAMYSDEGYPAAVQALSLARAKGDTLIKAVLIYSDGPSAFGGPYGIDGKSVQYIFDAAQISGIDLPVVLARKDSSQVFISRISDLFPMGSGFLNSITASINLPPVRLNNRDVT